MQHPYRQANGHWSLMGAFACAGRWHAGRVATQGGHQAAGQEPVWQHRPRQRCAPQRISSCRAVSAVANHPLSRAVPALKSRPAYPCPSQSFGFAELFRAGATCKALAQQPHCAQPTVHLRTDSAAASSGVFGSHGSVGKLVRRHTMDSDAMQEASNSGRHGNSSGRHGSGSSTRCVPGVCKPSHMHTLRGHLGCVRCSTPCPTQRLVDFNKANDAAAAGVRWCTCHFTHTTTWLHSNTVTVVWRIACCRMLPDRPEVGYCVQPNSQRVFQIPLQGEAPNLTGCIAAFVSCRACYAT
jgi:hypothetical protein